jgi:hypothetical protein
MKHLLSLIVFLSIHTLVIGQPQPGYPGISEIMYNPPESGTDSLEFIEIANTSFAGADFSGYTIELGVDFVFPEGVFLLPGERVVIAKDSVAFESTFGISAFQWSNSSLVNTGEAIVFRHSNGLLIDSVYYGVSFPWPTEADGGGHSLTLCGLVEPNGWAASQNNTGIVVNGITIYADPGQAPACLTVGLIEQEDSELISTYPNPATTNLTIESRTPLAQVWVRDVAGRQVITQTLKQVQGDRAVVDVSALPSGIYLVEVLTQNGQRSVQKVVVE